jgi:hypothetical protein
MERSLLHLACDGSQDCLVLSLLLGLVERTVLNQRYICVGTGRAHSRAGDDATSAQTQPHLPRTKPHVPRETRTCAAALKS